MATLSAPKTQNDFAPEFRDGKPTDAQIQKERTVLFFQVLKGLGIPRQVIRFIHTLQTLTKPGKLYNFNDLFLADHMGCDGSPTTRNYVVNLRKKLREWNNGFYDEVLRTKHFSFVSIIENEFDYRIKNQIPTGYIYSEKFAAILEALAVRVREHPDYKRDWVAAVRKVAGAAGHDELQEFGLWNKRKLKRPRPVEDILGTLLLNTKRLIKKFIETSREFGFDGEQTREWLGPILQGYLLQANFQSLEQGPLATVRAPGADPELDFHDPDTMERVNYVRVKSSKRDFEKTFSKVFAYVSTRDNPGEIDNGFKIYEPTRRRGGINHEVGQNGSNSQRIADLGKRNNGNRVLPEFTGPQSRGDIELLQTEEFDAALGESYKRFMERLSERSRKAKGSG